MHACPRGLPPQVYEHHWEGVHDRGQAAALAGDYSPILRVAAEAGCQDCVLALLRLDPTDEGMLRNTGRGGWDAAGWADWGATQAAKAGDQDRFKECTKLEDLLERMKSEGLQAVLGEIDYERSELSQDAACDDFEVLAPLPW